MPNTKSKEYEPNVTMGPIINLGIEKTERLSNEDIKKNYPISIPTGKGKKKPESKIR